MIVNIQLPREPPRLPPTHAPPLDKNNTENDIPIVFLPQLPIKTLEVGEWSHPANRDRQSAGAKVVIRSTFHIIIIIIER